MYGIRGIVNALRSQLKLIAPQSGNHLEETNMSDNKGKIQLFEAKKVRSLWDEENEKWWFSVIDTIAVLTEQSDELTARKYWNKLKQRLKEEGNETVTDCHQLKMVINNIENK